jgi:hypothetical protein
MFLQVHYKSGEAIVKQGTKSDNLYIISKGKVHTWSLNYFQVFLIFYVNGKGKCIT